MLNKIILIFLFLLLSLHVEAVQTLKGGVSYTIAVARKIAFENIEMEIPIDSFQKRMIDNTRFKFFKDITVFSDGDYALFSKKHNRCYYYSSDGNLKIIELIVDYSYPKKTVRYNTKGMLDTISLDFKNNEQFIFDANKKLIAHWIGKNCYNENGELIKTRD